MMELDALSRTALIPFWARAQDAISRRPVLGDALAATLAPRVRELLGVFAVDRSTEVGCCLRNLIVDRWLGELVDARTAIVEIGVGLDTRVHRMARNAGQYVEVDREQVIRLRDELAPTGGAVRIAADGLVVDSWAGALGSPSSQRVVLTIEGVLAYQTSDAVARFFNDAARTFPGAYVIFDRLSPSAVERANRPGARSYGRPEYRWSLDAQPDGRHEGPVTLLREQGFMDLPRHLRSRLPTAERLMHALPPRRSSYKLLLCQLTPERGGR